MPAAGTRTSSSRIVVSGSLRWPPAPPAPGRAAARSAAATAAVAAAALTLAGLALVALLPLLVVGGLLGLLVLGPVVAVLGLLLGAPVSVCCLSAVLLARACLSCLGAGCRCLVLRCRGPGRPSCALPLGAVVGPPLVALVVPPGLATRLAAGLGGLDRVDELGLLHRAGTRDAEAAGHRLQVGEEHGVEPAARFLAVVGRAGVGSGSGGVGRFRHVWFLLDAPCGCGSEA